VRPAEIGVWAEILYTNERQCQSGIRFGLNVCSPEGVCEQAMYSAQRDQIGRVPSMPCLMAGGFPTAYEKIDQA
jgi:hypothetical protein